MPKPGRNDPCPCGSRRRPNTAVAERRGPSEEQLARAHLAALAHDAVHDLAHLSDEALEILWQRLSDLPTIDLSLHVELPELITPELQRLRDAVTDNDPDRGWDELRTVTEQIDTPQQRARLADAILQLRAQHRLTRAQAAYAIYHLSTRSPNTCSPRASPTPSPSRSAPAARPEASESPPNPDRLSGGSS